LVVDQGYQLVKCDFLGGEFCIISNPRPRKTEKSLYEITGEVFLKDYCVQQLVKRQPGEDGSNLSVSNT